MDVKVCKSTTHHFPLLLKERSPTERGRGRGGTMGGKGKVESHVWMYCKFSNFLKGENRMWRMVSTLAKAICVLANMEEPIGQVLKRTELSDGFILEKMSSPLGVFVIFESRPEALVHVSDAKLRLILLEEYDVNTAEYISLGPGCIFTLTAIAKWECSSYGRALALHARGT
nr:delta-1-pyrroline-5-carboxylate synthase-like [Tanacetum cinerariifolium]